MFVCVSLEPGSEYAGGALKGHLTQFVFSFVFVCLFVVLFVFSFVFVCLFGGRQAVSMQGARFKGTPWAPSREQNSFSAT